MLDTMLHDPRLALLASLNEALDVDDVASGQVTLDNLRGGEGVTYPQPLGPFGDAGVVHLLDGHAAQGVQTVLGDTATVAILTMLSLAMLTLYGFVSERTHLSVSPLPRSSATLIARKTKRFLASYLMGTVKNSWLSK